MKSIFCGRLSSSPGRQFGLGFDELLLFDPNLELKKYTCKITTLSSKNKNVLSVKKLKILKSCVKVVKFEVYAFW